MADKPDFTTIRLASKKPATLTLTIDRTAVVLPARDASAPQAPDPVEVRVNHVDGRFPAQINRALRRLVDRGMIDVSGLPAMA